jgi:hypothetical protein
LFRLLLFFLSIGCAGCAPYGTDTVNLHNVVGLAVAYIGGRLVAMAPQDKASPLINLFRDRCH